MDFKLTPEQLKKIDQFSFVSVEGEREDSIEDPNCDFAESLIDCSNTVYQWAMKNLNIEHYIQEQSFFSITIPEDIHALIKERRNPQYTEYSNAITNEVIFNYVAGMFYQNSGDVCKKIEEYLIQGQYYDIQNKNNYKIILNYCLLVEDPVMTNENNEIINDSHLVLELYFDLLELKPI